MSRSYKKYPYWKIERSCKKGKIFANNKVRSYLKSGKEVSDGKSYKKIYESWAICDLVLQNLLKNISKDMEIINTNGIKLIK